MVESPSSVATPQGGRVSPHTIDDRARAIVASICSVQSTQSSQQSPKTPGPNHMNIPFQLDGGNRRDDQNRSGDPSGSRTLASPTLTTQITPVDEGKSVEKRPLSETDPSKLKRPRGRPRKILPDNEITPKAKPQVRPRSNPNTAKSLKSSAQTEPISRKLPGTTSSETPTPVFRHSLPIPLANPISSFDPPRPHVTTMFGRPPSHRAILQAPTSPCVQQPVRPTTAPHSPIPHKFGQPSSMRRIVLRLPVINPKPFPAIASSFSQLVTRPSVLERDISNSEDANRPVAPVVAGGEGPTIKIQTPTTVALLAANAPIATSSSTSIEQTTKEVEIPPTQMSSRRAIPHSWENKTSSRPIGFMGARKAVRNSYNLITIPDGTCFDLTVSDSESEWEANSDMESDEGANLVEGNETEEGLGQSHDDVAMAEVSSDANPAVGNVDKEEDGAQTDKDRNEVELNVDQPDNGDIIMEDPPTPAESTQSDEPIFVSHKVKPFVDLSNMPDSPPPGHPLRILSRFPILIDDDEDMFHIRYGNNRASGSNTQLPAPRPDPFDNFFIPGTSIPRTTREFFDMVRSVHNPPPNTPPKTSPPVPLQIEVQLESNNSSADSPWGTEGSTLVEVETTSTSGLDNPNIGKISSTSSGAPTVTNGENEDISSSPRRPDRWVEKTCRVVPGTLADLLPELDRFYDGGVYRHNMRDQEENYWQWHHLPEGTKFFQCIWLRWSQEKGRLDTRGSTKYMTDFLDKYFALIRKAELYKDFLRHLDVILSHNYIEHDGYFHVLQYYHNLVRKGLTHSDQDVSQGLSHET